MPSIPKGSRRQPWKPDDEKQSGRLHRSKEYDTNRWKRERAQFLREHPLCVHCKQEGIIKTATVVDHKRRVNEGAEFWDRSNWQGLCTSHHNKKSGREAHHRGRG